MLQLQLNEYDRECLRKWGISDAEDARTRSQAEERLVVPDWLRRTMWRKFWADHDGLFRATGRIATEPAPHDRSGPVNPSSDDSPSWLRNVVPRQCGAERGYSIPETKRTRPLRMAPHTSVGSTIDCPAIYLFIITVVACCIYLGVYMLER